MGRLVSGSGFGFGSDEAVFDGSDNEAERAVWRWVDSKMRLHDCWVMEKLVGNLDGSGTFLCWRLVW